MSLQPGIRLGPYEILSALGAGGMGEVWKARDTRLDRIVAVKVLPEQLSADPQLRARLDREARAISSLNHPHICTLYDVGHQKGIDFLVLEYLEGRTLADRIATGPLPLSEAISIATQTADALDKAHRAGIVHRDLEPANIFLTKAGTKLLDFGLARTAVPPIAAHSAHAQASSLPTTPPNLTVQGILLGTFHYMAPEQLEGHEADPRSDIWAFGVILHEMITGRKAFDGRSAAAVMAAILEHDPAPVEFPALPGLAHVLAHEPEPAGTVVMVAGWADALVRSADTAAGSHHDPSCWRHAAATAPRHAIFRKRSGVFTRRPMGCLCLE